jgi:hypothetical protein
MAVRKRPLVVAATLLVTIWAALVPATAASAARASSQSGGVSANAYACNPSWISDGVHGTGEYARPNPPGPYSWTWTTETHRGHTGYRVVEIQCLLDFLANLYPSSGLYSGGVDGDFGPKTEAAVRNVQKLCFGEGSSQVDGRVGPITWPCLRHDLI